MNSIEADPNWFLASIAKSAGATDFYYKEGRLYADATQVSLGAALSAYDHVAELTSRAPSYRELRSDQYKALLSPEGTFETAVGDMLDALMKAVLLGDNTELAELAAIIQGIKSEIPEA